MHFGIAEIAECRSLSLVYQLIYKLAAYQLSAKFDMVWPPFDFREVKMSSTEKVLNHHLKCFGEGDLEGILSDYTDSSVFETPDKQLKGLEELRGIFTFLFEDFAKGEATFEMVRLSVDGDHAYIVWKAQTVDNDYHVGTDTFVVRGGKIVYQTFAGHITPRN